MGYLDQAVLFAADEQFRSRCRMCIAEQAKIYYNDTQPEYKEPARIAIQDVDVILHQMYPLICSEPGMGNTATDEQILSAVQMLWPIIGDMYKPINPVNSATP